MATTLRFLYGGHMTDTRPSARDALRHDTRDQHERVDAMFSMLRLDRPDDYGTFLLAQAGAFFSCEQALDAAGAAAVLPGWEDRRRSALLVDDLAALGLVAPAAVDAPAFEGAAAILGGIYVLEGSRLGGAMLVRSVPPEWPRAFLSASIKGGWRTLMQSIDVRVQSVEDIAAAVAAARDVFDMFDRSGQAVLKAA